MAKCNELTDIIEKITGIHSALNNAWSVNNNLNANPHNTNMVEASKAAA